jgi:fluoride ion exporter CrcB/FEX
MSSLEKPETADDNDNDNTRQLPKTLVVLLHTRQLLVLALFAILGVLARRGLTLLTTYNGSYVSGVIWANFTSCLIMGMLDGSSNVWNHPNNNKNNSKNKNNKTDIVLYVGLTTGFCGSLSSFSSLILEMFLESADLNVGGNAGYRNAGGYGIMQFFSVLISQLCVSCGGFQLGRHLAQFYDPIVRPPAGGLKLVEDLCVWGGLASWIAVVCLIVVKGWRSWVFSCIVSPVACWLRYYVSKQLNPRNKDFPWGTFTINVLATLILAVLTIVNRGKTPHGRIIGDQLSCHLVNGLEDGFCGTLSTVSTFVVELYKIRKTAGKSHIYGAVTVLVSYSVMVVILGSYSWTQGLDDPVC